jgi:hypothetical protein
MGDFSKLQAEMQQREVDRYHLSKQYVGSLPKQTVALMYADGLLRGDWRSQRTALLQELEFEEQWEQRQQRGQRELEEFERQQFGEEQEPEQEQEPPQPPPQPPPSWQKRSAAIEAADAAVPAAVAAAPAAADAKA